MAHLRREAMVRRLPEAQGEMPRRRKCSRVWGLQKTRESVVCSDQRAGPSLAGMIPRRSWGGRRAA